MYESIAPLFDLAPRQQFPRLLGDIGGTNSRFGWQSGPDREIEKVAVLPCTDHETLLDAVQHYLHIQGLSSPLCAAFGIANPVLGDTVSMTNHHWQFSIKKLRTDLGAERLLVLNDFTALALAIRCLSSDSFVKIGTGVALPNAAVALLGPGTGLGVSGLIPIGNSGEVCPVVGEGGHVSLSPMNATEFAIIECLRSRYGHVSAERVVSGIGLPDLFHALCKVKGYTPTETVDSAQVISDAHERPASPAAETLHLFCSFLGDVAGNLALTLGAKGGVYIGGGIVPRMIDFLGKSQFRARFAAKGRFQEYLSSIPIWVICTHRSPALLGASNALNLIGR